MIRAANFNDIDSIMNLGRALHASVRDLPPIDEPGCKMLLVRAINHKRRFVVVSEKNGVMTGFMFGMIEELFYSKEKEAVEIVTYAEDGMSGALMLRRFIKWAREMKAARIQVGVTSGLNLDRVDALYQRLGLKRAGALYIGN